MDKLNENFKMSQMMADSINHDMKERVIKTLINDYMKGIKEKIEKEVRGEVEKYTSATVDEVRDYMMAVDEYQVRIKYETTYTNEK